MQAYSDPKRESDPHALPDVEVFYRDRKECNRLDAEMLVGADPRAVEGGGFVGHKPGWYWWTCMPGCLPDSEPFGPFGSEAEALADAQDAGCDCGNNSTLACNDGAGDAS